MKVKHLLAAMALVATGAWAHTDDPVLMTVGDRAVTRSEFERFYDKSSDGALGGRKSLGEYAELFADYKLKVLAAEEAGIDTTAAFRAEWRMLYGGQTQPVQTAVGDIENEARSMYCDMVRRAGSDGMQVHVWQILVGLGQQATKVQQELARVRADSIYSALCAGADFDTVARRFSADTASAAHGGDLGWIGRGRTVREFEEQVFAAKDGSVSRPFISPFGYHIIKVSGRRDVLPYDSVRADICRSLSQRVLRGRVFAADTATVVSRLTDGIGVATPTENDAEGSLQADSLDILQREYRDGLLLCAISNRMVWERAASDEAALTRYFKRNRKRYACATPRFRNASGKLCKKPVSYTDVRDLVVADLCEDMERHWVAGLRKAHEVVIDKAVLATVNNR